MKKFVYITSLVLVWTVFFPFGVIYQLIFNTRDYLVEAKRIFKEMYNTPSEDLHWTEKGEKQREKEKLIETIEKLNNYQLFEEEDEPTE